MSLWSQYISSLAPKRWYKLTEAIGATQVVDYGSDAFNLATNSTVGATSASAIYVGAPGILPNNAEPSALIFVGGNPGTNSGISSNAASGITTTYASTTWLTWFSTNNPNISQGTLFMSNALASDGFGILLDNGVPTVDLGGNNLYVSFCASSSYINNATGSVSIVDNKPHLLVVTFNASKQAQMYLDGVAVANLSTATPGATTAASAYFAIAAGGTGTRWQGALNDVVMIPSLLTPAQISSLYTFATTPSGSGGGGSSGSIGIGI
jgi:hypothetical protein